MLTCEYRRVSFAAYISLSSRYQWIGLRHAAPEEEDGTKTARLPIQYDVPCELFCSLQAKVALLVHQCPDRMPIAASSTLYKIHHSVTGIPRAIRRSQPHHPPTVPPHEPKQPKHHLPSSTSHLEALPSATSSSPTRSRRSSTRKQPTFCSSTFPRHLLHTICGWRKCPGRTRTASRIFASPINGRSKDCWRRYGCSRTLTIISTRQISGRVGRQSRSGSFKRKLRKKNCVGRRREHLIRLEVQRKASKEDEKTRVGEVEALVMERDRPFSKRTVLSGLTIYRESHWRGASTRSCSSCSRGAIRNCE